MVLWSSGELLAWLPAWLPLESFYLILLALAIYLLRFVAWLVFHVRARWVSYRDRRDYQQWLAAEAERQAMEAAWLASEARRREEAEAFYRMMQNRRLPDPPVPPVSHQPPIYGNPSPPVNAHFPQPPVSHPQPPYGSSPPATSFPQPPTWCAPDCFSGRPNPHPLAAYRREHPRKHMPEELFRAWYNDYLTTPLWKERRDAIMSRDNGLCQFCYRAPAQQVHHLTYERVGDEAPGDLISVCIPCHEEEHGRSFQPLHA